MKDRLTDCEARMVALREGKRFYIPPMACRNGHLSVRYTNGGGCVACLKEKADRVAGREVVDSGGGVISRVYVFSAGEYVKVGIAENVASRLQVTRTHCPLPVELAYQSAPMRRWLAKELEREAHDSLEPFSVTGEWFSIAASDAVPVVEEIAGRRSISPKEEKIEPAQAGFFSS